MFDNINEYQPRNGRLMKENGSFVNEAEGINPDGSKNVKVVDGIAKGAVTIVPSDSVNLVGGATKGIYLGKAGNVAVVMADGSEATFVTLSAGVIHPISVLRVKATGTLATDIIGVY